LTVDKTCKEFTVHLKHVGQLPKAAMGHTWVLTKEADKHGVATDGMAAGLDKDYVKAGDTRGIAHTAVLSSGESNSVKFDATHHAACETHTFLFSFPRPW